MSTERPLEVHVSTGALLKGAALLALLFIGDFFLPSVLDIDPFCWDERTTRYATVFEIIACSSAAGLRGWLYLAWFAAPIVVAFWYLRRAYK